MDPQKLNAATAAITKLESMVPAEAKMFKAGLEAAKADLLKYSKGGIIQGLKNIVTGDPMLKATAMGNALQAGFAALPKILTMFLPQNMRQEGQRSCFELIPTEKQTQFVDAMTQAFSPSGTGSIGGDIKSMFSNNVMPYINNLNAAVKEMTMNVAPNGAFKLGQQAAATPAPEIQKAAPEQGKPGQAEQTPGQATQATPGTANAPTTSSEPTQAAAATDNTKETAPTQAAKAPTPQKKLNPKTDSERINNISYFLASQTGIDKAAAQKLIAKLAELNGLTDIPTPQKPSNKLAGAAPPAAAEPAKV